MACVLCKVVLFFNHERTAKTTAINAGYGWTNEEALGLYGWYTMLVYVASVPGGIVADRLFGQKKTVMLGGLLLCLGHSILAVDALWAFYAGCFFIILGVGCLKANISSMVGGLYKKGDSTRDKGFYIFYIGINLGAFIAGFLVGYIGENINWHYGFGMAGIGMFIGQIIYMWGQKYLRKVGNLVKPDSTTEKVSIGSLFKDMSKSYLNVAISIILLIVSIYIISSISIPYGILTLSISIFAVLAMGSYRSLNRVDKDKILVLLLSFLLVIAFWGAFEQAGGLMNLYAKQKTDRFISLMNLDILFIGIISILGVAGLFNSIKKRKAKYWYLGSGLLLTIYLVLKEWVFVGDPFEIPAGAFQSVNSFFIFILAVPIANFWYFWRQKKREASSLLKIPLGLIIMGWGFLFMSAASLQYMQEGSSAMYWLILAYLFHTIGELCSSPVSLSFITKLAPIKYGSIMMGIYFAATGLGNKLAGVLGEWSQQAGELEIFTGIAIFCTVFGGLVILIIKPLKRLTHGVEETEIVSS